ncbi:UDP-N-acetylmuramoyl-tripeptide--D-alanyl-D-alanine ligase [Hathewaya proteolytica DSM 3090]|uniref:UDP-N-acetylmuramoyl-tripeptide--D-alanyl-D-alanine ligase n=1 Tax=Hathewaya proteolytica DSM 3090 TaxID=1121331 RepID=A0A1M6L7I4_9CLOT|nr:UDP-N-acetylmuramoyl-tripeptide--D-alanyl-D-alanine ligase [Hathewaya proteolytica]SHJ67162.1 UDP-N-acetylmuramoyl-tripeptide--D-alanyl-D-alanine ligase [Hathewaya proteolytica DSM 3090]
MEALSLYEINEAINGKILRKKSEGPFYNINTDTRTIKSGDVFLALKGENFDGNLYVQQAIEKGASLCIVDHLEDEDNLSNSSSTVILVDSSREALKALAKYYREKLKIKVVGITGSTGKTSTKDLMAAALSGKYKVFKTKGNFNNDIGLPLMILSMDSSYDVAVLEMGMSNLNEIHQLSYVANPEIAVITNVGVSHLENLKTRENILKAKMEITDFFDEKNVLIVNGDNDYLSTVKSSKFLVKKIGYNVKNSEFIYDVQDIINNESGIEYDILEKRTGKTAHIALSTPGEHNVLNSQLAIAVAREMGLEFEEIQKGFQNIESTSMRLELIESSNIRIVNDSYNASPDSVRAGIDYLNVLNGKRKICILGTMRELGDNSYQLHKEVAVYAKDKGIDVLLVNSEFSEAFVEGFNGGKVKCFKTNEELASYYNSIKEKGDAVLVKASRSMKFENIVAKIM